MAGSVGGTPNDTVGSTANGIRSHSDYAGGGDHGLPRPRLTEDQAARPPEPRRLKRATRRAGQRPAAADGAGREGCVPLRSDVFGCEGASAVHGARESRRKDSARAGRDSSSGHLQATNTASSGLLRTRTIDSGSVRIRLVRSWPPWLGTGREALPPQLVLEPMVERVQVRVREQAADGGAQGMPRHARAVTTLPTPQDSAPTARSGRRGVGRAAPRRQ